MIALSENSSAPRPRLDRRVQRTRTALLAAFRALILERGWEGFRAGDVAARADVGRSTLYEHFQGKEDMLGQSMAPLLGVLAAAGESEGADPRLEGVLAHFWDNRRMARPLLGGPAEAVIQRRLAEMISERLEVRPGGSALPRPLACALIARAQLGLVTEWLYGRHRCAAAPLAEAMASTTRALQAALIG